MVEIGQDDGGGDKEVCVGSMIRHTYTLSYKLSHFGQGV